MRPGKKNELINFRGLLLNTLFRTLRRQRPTYPRHDARNTHSVCTRFNQTHALVLFRTYAFGAFPLGPQWIHVAIELFVRSISVQFRRSMLRLTATLILLPRTASKCVSPILIFRTSVSALKKKRESTGADTEKGSKQSLFLTFVYIYANEMCGKFWHLSCGTLFLSSVASVNPL